MADLMHSQTSSGSKYLGSISVKDIGSCSPKLSAYKYFTKLRFPDRLLLLKTLEANKIDLTAFEAVSLSPADARTAFERGHVDAWSIWDPFLAVAQTTENVRGLKVGQERRTFFLSAQKFVKTQPELLKVVLAEAQQNGEWVKQNIRSVAEKFSKDINVDVATLEEVYQRRSWDVLPVDTSIQKAQQQVADTFYNAQVIPKPLQVSEVFLTGDDYAKIFPKG